MTRLAHRWLYDTVTVRSASYSRTTRPTGADDPTLGVAYQCDALVRAVAVDTVEGDTLRRQPRTLVVWVSGDAAQVVAAGWRVTIDACTDTTLTGKVGTVVAVERPNDE